MAEKMLMLALSPTMEEGTIVTWHKKEGDTVASGDTVCEVETDKATMDYESLQEGTLLKILVQEGQSAKVEQPIAVIGEEGEDVTSLMKEIEAAAKEEPSKDEPSKDESAEKEAQAAQSAAAEKPAEPAAPKSPAGAESKPESKPESKAKETGVAVKQGPAPAGEETPAGGAPQAVGPEDAGRIKASPLARNMAAEAGIDLTALSGSGPDGRIVKQDVEEAMKKGMPIRVPAGAATGSGAAYGAAAGAGRAASAGFAAGAAVSATGIDEQRIPVGRKRAVIAKRLSESKFTAPHYYLSLSVSLDTLTESRRSLNQQRTARGESKLSLNAFLMKLTAEAIKRYPIINASWEESEIHVFGSIDIGLAVALDDGLITPVVRNCGGKGIVRIDTELQELIARARSGKLTPEEYTGATFSISNLGSYGIEEFTAIINPPASAILAVGAAVKQPVELDDGSIFFDNRMKITLSCDHRVIDGAVGAEFMGALKSIIEDPLHALV